MPGFDKPILLMGRENMNRAIQGDIVAVEVFPESEWKAPTDEVVDQECKNKSICMKYVVSTERDDLATLKNDDADDTDEEASDDEEARAEQRALREANAKRLAAERQPTGRIVGVIKRNWRS